MTDIWLAIIYAGIMLVALAILGRLDQRRKDRQLAEFRREFEEHCKQIEARYKDGQQ